MDETHQRIYDEWVTAGRPGNKHPRSLLELLRRERKARKMDHRTEQSISAIEDYAKRLCELFAPVRDEVSESGRRAAFTRELVLAHYRQALADRTVNTHDVMRRALDDAEQLWMALPEAYR